MHELGAGRLFIVFGMASGHAILHQTHFPFFFRVKCGTLKQLAFAPFKARAAILGAQ